MRLSPGPLKETKNDTDEIPDYGRHIESVFDLKSGARAKLVDRSGSMVIIEIDKYRSDWIEWSEVKARIAAKDR